MIVLGRYLVGLHLGLLLPAALLIGGALGGFRGAAPMVISTLLVLIGWIFFAVLVVYSLRVAIPLLKGQGDGDRALRWTRAILLYLVILAPVTGLGLAFVSFINCGPTWVPNFYHWAGFVATILGFAAWFTLPLFARLCLGSSPASAPARRWWVIALTCGLVALVWGLVWLIPFLMLRGSVDVTEYASATATYKLPWRGGEDSWVIQGTDSGLNHNNSNSAQKYSWDFRRSCGSAVEAAAAGTVTRVVDTNDGIGGDNNLVEVTQADSTVASYLHIQRGSAVAVGTAVAQGDQVARAGCVGNSLTGHIHFMVKKGGVTIPVRFADVTEDDGIPRGWSSYTSGNR